MNNDDKNKKDNNDAKLGCLGLFALAIVIVNPLLGFIAFLILIAYYLFSMYAKNRLVSKEYFELYKSEQEINTKIQRLEQQANENIDKNKQKANAELKEIENKISQLKSEKSDLKIFLDSYSQDISYKISHFDYLDNLSSSELKNEYEKIKLKEKEQIKKSESLTSNSIEKKKVRQLNRAFNSEADHLISTLTIKNSDTIRTRIVRSYEQLNKLYDTNGFGLSEDALNIKLEKLEIAYRYQVEAMKEKELLKAQKEEIKEQQRAEKELNDAKQRIEKEERQFNNEINRLMKYLSSSNSEIEKELYADKIRELESKLKELESEKQKVSDLELNTRAGFVYIISNIGSFGENVYKIGMTRRLEPMNRVNELSSASVPFPFDVHALIFSEDAPGLENLLHKHFRKEEINKVNHRKEFFKVNLEDIKELITKEYNDTVHFIDTAAAEQYYESINIENREEELSE